MRGRVEHFLLLAVALLLFDSGQAAGRNTERPRQTVRSLDQLLPEIRRHMPGSFYDADGPYNGVGHEMRYRVKWMSPDGQIVWLEVDADSGRIIGIMARNPLHDDPARGGPYAPGKPYGPVPVPSPGGPGRSGG